MTGSGPIEVDETPGVVAWCSCGRTRYPPYCDGSHGDSGAVPLIVWIERVERVIWCGCQRSANPPFCDRRGCAAAD